MGFSEYRPKIMLIDKWNVAGRFPWDSYASCIDRLLDDYFQWLDRPYYLRKDLLGGDMGVWTVVH